MSSILKFLQEMDQEKPEEIKPIGENLMKFGRHKGATYDNIYENDKEYVKWIITNKEDKYIKKIKAYFVDRIQQDYGTD